MTPPKEGIFTNIGKNYGEMLQIEDLAEKNVFLFYYVHIFCEKNLNLYHKHFMNLGGFFLNILWKKVLACSKGPL